MNMAGVEAGDKIPALTRRLKQMITENGPMPVSAFMALALVDPVHGYYARHAPFGAAGDFVTAPELSQMFGEIIGGWVHAAWVAAGCPARLDLVEPGPGSGVLMRDMLRVLGREKRLADGLCVHLVESSARLREIQAQMLAPFALPKRWHRRIEDIAAGKAPLFIIANEFLDALPVRQLIHIGGRWHERCIALDGKGGFVFHVGPGVAMHRAPVMAAPDRPPEDGHIIEISPAALTITGHLCGLLARAGGIALMIDYGYEAAGRGDTLRAISRHRQVAPLERPGTADLTADVDFAALCAQARRSGAQVFGPVPQGRFLRDCGIGARAAQLAARADPPLRAILERQLRRLTDDEEMGASYKVCTFAHDGPSGLFSPGFVPPGFVSSWP